MSWIYIKSEPNLWTVGFYDPSGKWHPDSDHESKESARERIHYLNGGEYGKKNDREDKFRLKECAERLKEWSNR